MITVKCVLSHIEGGWLAKNKSTFKLWIVLRIRIDASYIELGDNVYYSHAKISGFKFVINPFIRLRFS